MLRSSTSDGGAVRPHERIASGDVAGLGDDLELRLGVEQHPQPAADDGVVVGEDDRRGHVKRACRTPD